VRFTGVLGDLFALAYVLTRLTSAQEIPYAAIEAVCHSGVWLIVALGHSASGRPRTNRISAWLGNLKGCVEVGENHLGKAVFANRHIEAGGVITQFGGTPLNSRDLPTTYLGTADRFMQIDQDSFLGPSGRVDDFINHSCDPNAGIRFSRDGILLVALRPITAGEEVCWDYSTTMHQTNWLMRCECGTAACRKYVSGFMSLPPMRRSYYLAAGVVAPFIVKWLETEQTHGGSEQSLTEAGGEPTLTDIALWGRDRQRSSEPVDAPYAAGDDPAEPAGFAVKEVRVRRIS
jgi:hypothetical protein